MRRQIIGVTGILFFTASAIAADSVVADVKGNPECNYDKALNNSRSDRKSFIDAVAGAFGSLPSFDRASCSSFITVLKKALHDRPTGGSGLKDRIVSTPADVERDIAEIKKDKNAANEYQSLLNEPDEFRRAVLLAIFFDKNDKYAASEAQAAAAIQLAEKK
jgi:hypothetical protein